MECYDLPRQLSLRPQHYVGIFQTTGGKCFISNLSFEKIIKSACQEQDLPRALITDMIRTDMCCICAQFANIFRDSNSYKKFLKTQDDNAQELLDLLQGVRKWFRRRLPSYPSLRQLLDYPLLDSRIQPILLRGLLKLSKKSKQHPRCLTLSDLQLTGYPVTGGSFGDIYKIQFQDETVCVKVMRMYQEADVEALLKVSRIGYCAEESAQVVANAGVPLWSSHLAAARSS